MKREDLLKNYILSQYKSLREFCIQLDVPYSTLANVFQRGLMKSSVSLIIKICDRLNIDVDSLVSGEIKEKAPVLDGLTMKERYLILAYRNNPAMQSAVDKLLGIEPEPAPSPSENTTIADDLSAELSEALKKNSILK